MPRGDKLSGLASALGVSVDELLDDKVDAPLPARQQRNERQELMASIETLCARLDVLALQTVRQVIEGFVKLNPGHARPEQADSDSGQQLLDL
ncbi:MAG: hypothetical protein JWM76_680 [Pseudonocardiales bacterium]|nr:hypothetical protein [Pseudonocardiales bacterium]